MGNEKIFFCGEFNGKKIGCFQNQARIRIPENMIW